MKVEEEIKPAGDGARSERQEPGRLRELDATVGRLMGLEVLGEVICVPNPEDWRLEIPIRARERETDKHRLKPVYLNKCVCDQRYEEDSMHLGHIWLCLRIVPDYSTNRSAALEIVDHFAEADWRIMLTSNPHAPQSLRWRVELFKELWPNNISVMELAETLPEAICLAALSAKAAEANTR